MQQLSSAEPVSGPRNHQTNDYHYLPATEKQLNYARQISQKIGHALPWEIQQDRKALSRWIEENRNAQSVSRFADYPTSKQVAFAERIARYKRSEVPQECFRDRSLMSNWIDNNK